MPEYEVHVRYMLAWTASRVVRAKTEEEARGKTEKEFTKVADYASFEEWVSEDSTPQLDEESLEIDEVTKL